MVVAMAVAVVAEVVVAADVAPAAVLLAGAVAAVLLAGADVVAAGAMGADQVDTSNTDADSRMDAVVHIGPAANCRSLIEDPLLNSDVVVAAAVAGSQRGFQPNIRMDHSDSAEAAVVDRMNDAVVAVGAPDDDMDAVDTMVVNVARADRASAAV
jgi:hypothetical protein